MPEERLRLLARAANAFEVVAGAARHGPGQFEPPDAPMSLEDAEALAAHVVARWLGELRPLGRSRPVTFEPYTDTYANGVAREAGAR